MYTPKTGDSASMDRISCICSKVCHCNNVHEHDLNQAVETIGSLLPDVAQMAVLKCQQELFLLRR